MKNLAVFASGSGTNAQNLIQYFNRNPDCNHTPDEPINAPSQKQTACVKMVICNKPDAYVLTRAKQLGIQTFLLTKDQLTTQTDTLFNILAENNIDLIILAGYLLKIPATLIVKYPNRIINIHPALLPSYGGKGMFGHHVHEAVIAAGEKKSGITIHLVDEKYDHGQILFQAECQITPQDTPDTLAGKIHLLEQTNFPRVVEQYIITLT